MLAPLIVLLALYNNLLNLLPSDLHDQLCVPLNLSMWVNRGRSWGYAPPTRPPALLGASLLGTLGLLHYLAAVSMGDGRRRTLVRSIALMVLVVVLMTATLRRIRSATYEDDSPDTTASRANSRE